MAYFRYVTFVSVVSFNGVEILFLPLEHKIHIFSPPCNILYLYTAHITSCLMAVYKHTSSGYHTSIGKHYCEFTRYTLRNILTRATKTWRIYDSKRNSQDIHSSCDFIRGNLKRSHSFGCLWRLVQKVIAREFASIFHSLLT